ncbi:MAG: hypothetical protein J5939_08625, partial [Bacteroidales bacterium]|nr:hypothetical protein [Bacteroidales bacterium]
MKRFLIVLAALSMILCAAAQPARRGMGEVPTDESFDMKEISCMSAGKKLYGEAFFPKAPGKHPAIILSHGYNGSHR